MNRSMVRIIDPQLSFYEKRVLAAQVLEDPLLGQSRDDLLEIIEKLDILIHPRWDMKTLRRYIHRGAAEILVPE